MSDTQPNTAQAEARPDAARSDSLLAEDLPGCVEAILLTHERPLADARIAEMLQLPGESAAKRVSEAVETLNRVYEESGRSFRIERVAGGRRVMTLPRFAPALAAANALRQETKLSRAALETLSIVAYRQPITRAELEAIRGVACGEVLRTLLERRLIAISGRAEEPGRPLLYATSKRFLEVFGLASVKDLPEVDNPTTRNAR